MLVIACDHSILLLVFELAQHIQAVIESDLLRLPNKEEQAFNAFEISFAHYVSRLDLPWNDLVEDLIWIESKHEGRERVTFHDQFPHATLAKFDHLILDVKDVMSDTPDSILVTISSFTFDQQPLTLAFRHLCSIVECHEQCLECLASIISFIDLPKENKKIT